MSVFTAMASESIDGTFASAIKIPHNVRGGEYSIQVSSLTDRVYTTSSRKVRIMDMQ